MAHTIANGGIKDEDEFPEHSGEKMSAQAVGELYVWLSNQQPTLWTHELDMRPAQEKVTTNFLSIDAMSVARHTSRAKMAFLLWRHLKTQFPLLKKVC